MCLCPSQKFTNQSSYSFHTNIRTCQVFNIFRAVQHTLVDIHLIFWVGRRSCHPPVSHISKLVFLPLDGFNQRDRREARTVESGFSSGGLLLILALSLSCNLIFYRVHNFLSAADTRVTSWEKVGRPVSDSGKSDCALKNPNQHTPYAAIQRKTYFMVFNFMALDFNMTWMMEKGSTFGW